MSATGVASLRLTEDAVQRAALRAPLLCCEMSYKRKVVFRIRRCPAFDLQRSGLASAWHRFSPCCGLFRASDRKRKSAARVPCMARRRRKVAVLRPTSKRTYISAFGVDRLAINSTSMRRPRAKACWRQPLICANERGAKFPGLGPTDSACPTRKRRGRSWQEFSFRWTERGAVAQNHRCAPSLACSGQELLAFCCAAARTSLPHSSLRNDDTSFTDRPAHVIQRLYAFTPCSVRQLPLASPQTAKMVLFQTAINMKMYDKAGRVLRIETVINNPGEFFVHRSRPKADGRKEVGWFPMNKGIANLYRYAQVGGKANERYLEALAVVNDLGVGQRELERRCAPVIYQGRRRRALQPLGGDDQALFQAALRGEHAIRGFRNGELAQQLFGAKPSDPAERRRHCGRVSRRISLLRAHGLIAKFPRSRRYRVTDSGQRFMSTAFQVRAKLFARQFEAAP
jgi:hypothetical protein